MNCHKTRIIRLIKTRSVLSIAQIKAEIIVYATNTAPRIHVVMAENGQHINGGLAWETQECGTGKPGW